ncbi:thioredoxin reductase glit [Aspergillus karnatakaensis]|uniref:thioredoxin reductase gliT n=1 Tax=Aspergillus karnatakaensis TaxID=1810916 RepID=UPI003CCDE6B8
MSAPETLYDALIIGSGPAGLSVALGLSRTHRRAAVFTKPNGAGFRNEGAHEIHNVITRDGFAPDEFRRIAREQIEKYGTTDFIEADIVDVEKADAAPGTPSYFTVKSHDGNVWKGRKLALAMGSIETLPDIEGYKENWPHNIFQCLFCDGHERSNLPGGILTFPNPMYTHMAQMMTLIATPTSGPVTVFTDGPVPEVEAMQKALSQIKALNCTIETGKVVKLVAAQAPDVGVTVVLEGGKEVKMGYLGHKPATVLAGRELLTKLGVEIEENPMLGPNLKVVDPTFSTTVKGVFVAGDAATPLKAAANAMSSGSTAAAGIVQQILMEDMELLMAENK